MGPDWNPHHTYRRYVACVVVGPAKSDRFGRIGIYLAFDLYRVHVNGADGSLLGAGLTAWRD